MTNALRPLYIDLLMLLGIVIGVALVLNLA